MEACLMLLACCASALMLSCSWWVLKSCPRPRASGLADVQEESELPAIARLVRRARRRREPEALKSTSRTWVNPR
jgi:hypothetical protein